MQPGFRGEVGIAPNPVDPPDMPGINRAGLLHLRHAWNQTLHLAFCLDYGLVHKAKDVQHQGVLA